MQVRFINLGSREYPKWELRLYEKESVRWTDKVNKPRAAVFPKRKLVIYDHSADLYARTYAGRIAWKAETPGAWSPWRMWGSADYLVMHSRGGTPGHNATREEMDEDITVTLLNVINGQYVWRASSLEMGYPLWMNAEHLIIVKTDYSKSRMLSKAVRGFDVWLEVRGLLDRKVRWRHKLPGQPEGKVQIKRSSDKELRLSSPEYRVPTNMPRWMLDKEKIYHRPVTMAIPLARHSSESGPDTPVVFSRPENGV